MNGNVVHAAAIKLSNRISLQGVFALYLLQGVFD